jgi:DNA-binding NarL/FixJ family response regulator
MPPQEILVCAKPSAARRVAGVLRSRGYAVETAADGARAVERAERDNPAVVLIWSDLRGPETSSVIRRIREASGAKVAVIVKSDAVDRASTFLEAGADTVIPNVRDLDRLARTVDRLLEGGLVVDPALDLPAGDDFEPEEPILNGKGGHAEEEAGPTIDPGAEETPPEATLLPEAEPGIAFEPCDVAEIVHEAAAEAALGHPSVVVQVAAPPRLPTVGHADALRGAVRALVEEACRDSEAASNVTVKAQRVDAGIFVLVAARGAGAHRVEAVEGGASTGFSLARALVALHGGILSAEPIPAGGNRVSFTIPEQPPFLQGMELQGGFRALELLAQAEAAREADLAPSSDPDAETDEDDDLLEQAIDLAAAAADAAALAPEPVAKPDRHRDPIRSLAELFGLELEDEPPEAEVEAPAAEVVVEEELESPPAEELEAEEEILQVEVEELPEVPAEPEPEEREEPVAAEEREKPVQTEQPEEEPAAAEPVLAEEARPVIDLPDEVPEPVLGGDGELEPPPEPDPEPVPEPVFEPVAIPEPVPAAEGSSAEPGPQPAVPPKSYVADPLHPATAILRALAEEFDDRSIGFQGF